MNTESFELWWEKSGQFSRAGGGSYEKTFAYNAWLAAKAEAAPSTPAGEPEPFTSEDRMRLMKFYGVSTVDALIEAQSKHVERLQAKLPKSPSFAPTFPRG